jgi:tRNA pseudouridine55 synthase
MGELNVTSLMELVEGRIVLIDKPLFWTSFDVVKKVRNQIAFRYRQIYNEKRKIKVGHAGTLDPLAEGLMVVSTGKKTKLLNTLQADNKEYIASIELGRTTPSFDLETMFDDHAPFDINIQTDDIRNVLKQFEGEIEQVPPVYSAKNVKGQRAYQAARKGEALEMQSIQVRIDHIELLDYYHPVIKVKVACSKGTYIRSLARDIGEKLRTGAHLVGLRRIRSGDFQLNNAISIAKFEQILSSL